MANEGLIPHGAARLLGKEWQPQPEEGECVLLATHVDRGFSLPPSVFFRGFLNFFGAQLHHLLVGGDLPCFWTLGRRSITFV